MKNARRPPGRALVRSRRLNACRRGKVRRLQAEPLERRTLLAADWGVSDYWNAAYPTDVNADGTVAPLDALLVINELNTVGSRAVMGPGAAPAEGETAAHGGQRRTYGDVNNDGFISPIDALLVINDLNAEGESPLVKYQIHVLPANAPLVNQTTGQFTPNLTTITKGNDYDFVVSVDDLRVGGAGVFSAYLDVLYNSSLTRPRVSEIQHLVINGNPDMGQFTLSFGAAGPTTQITYSSFLTTTTIANNIRTALEGLSNINPGDVLVKPDPIAPTDEMGTGAVPLRWEILFTGPFRDTDVPTLVANTANLSINIETTSPGVVTDPTAFREAFRSRIIPGVEDSAFFGDQQNALSAFNEVNKINELGAIAPRQSGAAPVEVVRARMRATDAGVINFVPDFSNILTPGHDTLLHLTSEPVPAMQIDAGTSVSLAITELVEANNDNVSVAEDSATGVTFNPITGVPPGLPPAGGQDRKLPGAANPALRIASVAGVSTPNQIITLPSGATVRFASNTAVGGIPANNIRYIPAANFSGPDSFTYTISDTVNTDSATVFVNVIGLNDAPTITVQGGTAKTTLEDTALVLSTANANRVTVDDIDNASLAVTLTAVNGTLTLGSTANVNPVGNGTATVMINGTLANLNNALNGLIFNPTPNLPTSGTTAAASIGVSANDGAATTNSTINITVQAVNDPPVNSVPAMQIVDEGGLDTIVFSQANGNRIGVSDIDAAAGAITVDLVAPNGTLTPVATTGVTVTPITNGIRLTGQLGSTVAPFSFINAALNGLVFTPNALFAGMTSLTVITNDQGNTGFGAPNPLSDTDVIAIDVVATERPRARPDSPSFAEDNAAPAPSYQFDVMQNDEGNLLDPQNPGAGTFPTTLEALFGLPSASVGVVEIVNVGNDSDKTNDEIRFTPADADFFGTVTFQYGIWDTSSTPPGTLPAHAIATVTLTITPTNDNPVAVDDTATTPEDTAVVIDVLANDSDADNDFGGPPQTLTPVVITNPTSGEVSFDSNTRTFTYTPDANFHGSDSFTYQVNDGQGGLSNIATVSLTVTPVNDAPIAVGDTFNPTEDSATPLVVAAPGVLANDTDPDNTAAPLFAGLSAMLVTPPAHGTLTLNPDGSFSYQPTTLNFDGTDSFTYKVVDGDLAESAPATVNLVYFPVNDAPVANDDLNFTMTEDTTLTIPAGGILANDTDVDSSVLTVMLPVMVITAPPGDPTLSGLSVNANGGFTFTPPQDFTGIVEFQYRAQDQNMLSNLATVRITVLEFNDPPTVANDSATTPEDTAVDIDVLANDSDPETANTALTLRNPLTDGDPLTSGPANGSIAIVGNQFRYTPNANFFGSDSFSYRVSDGQNVSTNVATVNVTVNEVNDNPVANDDGSTATPILIIKDFGAQVVSVLGNDTDADLTDGLPGNNDILRVITVSGGTRGTVVVDNPGPSSRILYTPNAGEEGLDTFTYTIGDGRGGVSNSATVTVQIIAFVPKTVSGVVYIDANNNGVQDFVDANNNGVFDPNETGERPIQGAQIRLTGTNFQDNPVLPAGQSIVTTDVDGKFSFDNLTPPKPGTRYIVEQLALSYVLDGQDSPRDAQDAASTSPVKHLVFDNANDSFGLFWELTDQSGDIDLHFGERGIDASQLEDSRGLLSDLLASSSNNGFILAADAAGNFLWSWTLPGWSNVSSLNVQLDATQATAMLTGTFRNGTPFSLRIHQDPSLNTTALGYPAGANNPYGPRFRVLGRTGDQYIFRIDGTAAEFGLVAQAAPPAGGAEGEATVDPDFARAADEVFSNAAWA